MKKSIYYYYGNGIKLSKNVRETFLNVLKKTKLGT